MNRNGFRLHGTFRTACLAIVCSALCARWCHVALAADEARDRPNVVLVITDDQGYGDVGAHGNTMIRTPNLDKLHAQSIRLTNFHVDPTCSPTRSALMTGRYSTRTGVWHTIMGRSIMRPEEVTLAEVFALSGYTTGMFGKWHLGDNYPCRPHDQGFQEAFYHGGGGVGQTPDYWGNDYFDDTYFRNGQPEKTTGYCTDVWFDNALKFIEKHKDGPFFAYISTNAPHGPFLVDAKYSEPYEAQGVPPTMARFYGMITNIDENVGRLLASLDRLDLARNTIVIFMTDNGTAAGVAAGRSERSADHTWAGFNAGMRGRKGSEYDGGHRVPFFVRWPAGELEGGREVNQLTAHIDVLPTLVELCRLTPPRTAELDGASLAPLLAGKSDSWPDRTLFVHSQRIETPEKWRKSSVMTQRWRLVNGLELYDVAADPGQQTDLAEKHADVVDRLRADYDRWWTSLMPRFTEFVPIAIGDDAENPTRITAHDWHGGDVPWNQPAVKRMNYVNGWWMIEATREAMYDVTLRHQPAEDPIPLQATTARIRIGNLLLDRPVPDGATEVTMPIPLRPSGPQKLQTWLTDDRGRSRGAFFVTITRHGAGST